MAQAVAWLLPGGHSSVQKVPEDLTRMPAHQQGLSAHSSWLFILQGLPSLMGSPFAGSLSLHVLCPTGQRGRSVWQRLSI